jgi:hypothetical protein
VALLSKVGKVTGTFRGERLPESVVTGYWNTLKQIVSESGHDVSQIPMPRNLEIHTKVPRRDFVRFHRMHFKEAREKHAVEEHGRVFPVEESHGCIHAGWRIPDGQEPTIILVRRNAPHVGFTIFHEMLHIFEDYLGVKPGTLASVATSAGRRLSVPEGREKARTRK